MKRSIILSILLAAVLMTAPVKAAPEPTRVIGLRLISMNTNAGATETHFIYELQSGVPAISHVDLTMCMARFLGVDTGSEQPITIEAKDNFVRIETPQMPDNGTLYLTVILAGNFSASETGYTIKAGQQVLTGTTFGALCAPTAVSLAGFTAMPDPDTSLLVALLPWALFILSIYIAARVRRAMRDES